MEHYKVLEISENATMDQVQRAYEGKVKKFKEEVKNKKMLQKFLKVFDEAYEAIKEEKQRNTNEDATVLMSSSKVESFKRSNPINNNYKEASENNDDATVLMSSSQIEAMKTSRNSYYNNDIEEEEDEYYEEDNGFFFSKLSDDDFEDYEDNSTKKREYKRATVGNVKGKPYKRTKRKNRSSILDLMEKPLKILEDYMNKE